MISLLRLRRGCKEKKGIPVGDPFLTVMDETRLVRHT